MPKSLKRIPVHPQRVINRWWSTNVSERPRTSTNDNDLVLVVRWCSLTVVLARWCLAVAIGSLLADPLQAEDTSSLPMLTPEARSAIEQGLSEFRDNKFEEAEKTFQKVTEMVPNHPVGWINLGSVEYRLGKLDDAERSLRKAVHLDPEVAQTWLTLGIISYNKDEREAALAALSQAVYLDSSNARAHMYLGVLMRKRGWLDAAEDELRKAVELDSTYAEAQFNLAMIYMERTPPAIELARRHYYRALALGAAADPEMERLLRRSPKTK
jgi:Flp pilus assembly protein TadD